MKLALTGVVCFVVLGAWNVQAADGTWTADADGNWNAIANWNSGAGPIADGDGFTADFSTINIAATRTVTADSRTIGTLKFGDTNQNNSGWIVQTGTLTLGNGGGAAVITVNNLGTAKATLNSPLAGSAGFTKDGVGTLVLGGTLSGLSGAITMNGGGLTFSAISQTLSNPVSLSAAATLTPSSVMATLGGGIDYGATRTLTVKGNNVAAGVLVLDSATAASGTGNVVVGGYDDDLEGANLAVTDMNQVAPGGYLSLDRGALILVDRDWAHFTGNRTGGFVTTKTGANTWSINNGPQALRGTGGFARRDTVGAVDPLVISGGTGVNASTFDRNFLLGAPFRDASGAWCANAPVQMAQNTTLTKPAGVGVRVSVQGPGYGGTYAGSVIHRITADVDGTSLLYFVSVGTASATHCGEVVLAGANSWSGTNADAVIVGQGGTAITGTGDLYVRFAGNANLPRYGLGSSGAYLFSQHAGAAAWLGGYLVTAKAGGETYTLPSGYKILLGIQQSLSARRDSVFGSASDDGLAGRSATFQGGSIVLVVQGTDEARSPGLLVRDGTLTLGAAGAGNQVTFEAANTAAAYTPATVLTNSTLTRTLTKLGLGTLILRNVEYMRSGVDATTRSTDPAPSGQYAWQIGRGAANAVTAPYFDGAVRETGTTSADSLTGFNIKLAGGVVEGSGTFSRGMGTATNQVRWSNSGAPGILGGGGFAAYGGPLTVNLGGAGAGYDLWDNGQLYTVPGGNPLMFGSYTADNVVTWTNTIGLQGEFDNTTVEREIRVYDNTNSTADRAVLSGNVRNRATGATGGTGTRSLVKAGDGILVLAGATNDYKGYTRVAAGTLLVNGNLNTNGLAVTNELGSTLGGTGTINRAVVVLGTLAPGDGSGTLGRLTVSDLTLGATATLAIDGTTSLLPYVIVAVNGTRTGTFTGLPERGVVFNRARTARFMLTYSGGDGNDVALEAPPTGTVLQVR